MLCFNRCKSLKISATPDQYITNNKGMISKQKLMYVSVVRVNKSEQTKIVNHAQDLKVSTSGTPFKIWIKSEQRQGTPEYKARSWQCHGR